MRPRVGFYSRVSETISRGTLVHMDGVGTCACTGVPTLQLLGHATPTETTVTMGHGGAVCRSLAAILSALKCRYQQTRHGPWFAGARPAHLGTAARDVHFPRLPIDLKARKSSLGASLRCCSPHLRDRGAHANPKLSPR